MHESSKIATRVFFTLLTLSLLSLITPLTFTNVWLRNTAYFLTVALAFIVAKELKNKVVKVAMIWLPLIGLLFLTFGAFAFSFADRMNDDWRDTWISHRQANHKEIYIGEQMLNVGAMGYARRVVKVVPVTPLFRWVTQIDTSRLDNSWIRVSEDNNPYNLKY